jgi:YD repeat-containing protein
MLGNGVQQTISKNNRLQIQSLTVNAPTGPLAGMPLLSHSYCYSGCATGGTANNGNTWGITDTLNPAKTQGFTYDGLNRISSFSLNGVLNQQYAIDSFGNLSGMSGNTVLSAFDPATNRLSNLPCASSVPGFDAAGNQLCSTDGNGAVSQYSYDPQSRISQIALAGYTSSPYVNYVYDANGSRIRKNNASGTFTEYVGSGGTTLAEFTSDGTWSDYIYANGQRIAKVDSAETRLHIYGNYANNGSVSTWSLPGPTTGYVIGPHDKLIWKQYETGVVGAGLALWINNWSAIVNGEVVDQDGQVMNHDLIQNQWHERVVDLNAYAGSTISLAQLVSDTYMGPGAWNVWYKDIVLVSENGTVTQMYTGQTGLPFWTSDTANQSQTVDVATTTPNGSALGSSDTTTYFLDDHLGTTAMQFSAGGWPIWQGQSHPLGQNWAPSRPPCTISSPVKNETPNLVWII